MVSLVAEGERMAQVGTLVSADKRTHSSSLRQGFPDWSNQRWMRVVDSGFTSGASLLILV